MRSPFPFVIARPGAKIWVALGACVMAMSLTVSPGSGAAPQACPSTPVPTIASSDVPTDVCIPDGFPDLPIQYFDDFSWRAFVAMVWPARTGERGVPDTSKSVGDAGPRVFETYKAQWEVFHADGSKPADWNTYDTSNACKATPQFGDLVLASFSKFSDIGQGGFGELLGPLAAQNKTYVRYITGMNKPEFDLIRSKDLYIRKNLPQGTLLVFPNGSIDVKSAWIDMTGIAHPERYYTRAALVLDPAGTGKCEQKTVGLIALHIVVKTPSRPQWIWTSFEQIDLIPQEGAMKPFALHDGDEKNLMPTENPLNLALPLPAAPKPVNVTRVKPIHDSTKNTNAAYRQLLEKSKSVWQFYQLVMTQWPVPPNSPKTPGNPANTFPGTGATTAFSNVALETFEQNSIGTGCMACHNFTRATDFLWVLSTRSFPADVPAAFPAKDERTALKNLLAEAHKKQKPPVKD